LQSSAMKYNKCKTSTDALHSPSHANLELDLVQLKDLDSPTHDVGVSDEAKEELVHHVVPGICRVRMGKFQWAWACDFFLQQMKKTNMKHHRKEKNIKTSESESTSHESHASLVALFAPQWRRAARRSHITLHRLLVRGNQSLPEVLGCLHSFATAELHLTHTLSCLCRLRFVHTQDGSRATCWHYTRFWAIRIEQKVDGSHAQERQHVVSFHLKLLGARLVLFHFLQICHVAKHRDDSLCKHAQASKRGKQKHTPMMQRRG
jgi:hypothetical protein